MDGAQSRTLEASETSRLYHPYQVTVVTVSNLPSWRSTLDQVMRFSMVQVSTAGPFAVLLVSVQARVTVPDFADYLSGWAVSTLTNGVKVYDKDGEIAASASPDAELLEKMLSHPYFARSPPKTTGREEFTADLGAEWIAAGQAAGLDDATIIATFTELTAVSIADAYVAHIPCGVHPADGSSGLSEVVIGGGGGNNKHMMSRLQHHLKCRWATATAAGAKVGAGDDDTAPAAAPAVVSHEDIGWDSDAKEAVTFAILGWLCVNGMDGNIPSCTGASAPAVLGKLAPGHNYMALMKKVIE